MKFMIRNNKLRKRTSCKIFNKTRKSTSSYMIWDLNSSKRRLRKAIMKLGRMRLKLICCNRSHKRKLSARSIREAIEIDQDQKVNHQLLKGEV
jgi:hypothetical protein